MTEYMVQTVLIRLFEEFKPIAEPDIAKHGPGWYIQGAVSITGVLTDPDRRSGGFTHVALVTWVRNIEELEESESWIPGS
jgi:hypothetical protein